MSPAQVILGIHSVMLWKYRHILDDLEASTSRVAQPIVHVKDGSWLIAVPECNSSAVVGDGMIAA